MIKSEDICVIIQGCVERGPNTADNLTQKGIISIREKLPGARIILSTWNGADCTGLEVDEIIYSQDPGFVKVNLLGNTNRQIVGRLSALKKCDRKYTLIMRADSEIINTNFIEVFNKYPLHKFPEYRFSKERVVICSMGSIHKNFLYHICDWFFFGLTEDLVKIYDIPLFVDKEDHQEILYNDSAVEQTPHSWVMMNFVEKFMDTDYKKTQCVSEKNIEECEKVILENFITLGFQDEYGIYNNKQPYLEQTTLAQCNIKALAEQLMYNFEIEDWVTLYNRLYGVNEIIKFRISWCIVQFVYFHEKFSQNQHISKILKLISCFIPSKQLRRKIRGQNG